MDSGPVVVDISSDEEADYLTGGRKCWDAPCDAKKQMVGDKEKKGGDVIVDLDQYLCSMEGAGDLRPMTGAVRDDLDDDDCVVLEDDPDKLVAVGDGERGGGDGADDVLVVGQKGQVACRDFPHSRHLCANFPFNTTSHEKHCKLCHCFVCDSPAPCIYWANGVSSRDHCHATDMDECWKTLRRMFKKKNTVALPPRQLSTHSLPQPFKNPGQGIHRYLTPIVQPPRTGSLRPCNATRVPTERSHQNSSNICNGGQRPTQHRAPSDRAQSVQRPYHGGLGVTHPQFKRFGSARPVPINSSMMASQHPAPSLNQTQITAPNRPQHLPVTSFGSQPLPVAPPRTECTPVAPTPPTINPVTTGTYNMTTPSSDQDSMKKWQDILAGVAAELGVADTLIDSTTALPYTASSQSPAFSAPLPCQVDSSHGMMTNTDLQPTTTPVLPSDPLLPAYIEMGSNSADIDVGSFFANVGDAAAFVPGEEAVLQEVNLGSFLCDPGSSWSSIANV